MIKFTPPILISHCIDCAKKLSPEQRAKLLSKGSYIKKDSYIKSYKLKFGIGIIKGEF